MPRPFRLEYAGAYWHVYNRGVEGRDIFLTKADRIRFLDLLGDVADRFRWRVHEYVEMTNHYHLLVETLEPTLSRGMQKLDGDFAKQFNRRHGRYGHLFQGRFRGHLIDSESYLLTLSRYIIRNPVRANMVTHPAEWAWSSYRPTMGLAPVQPWLHLETKLSRFDPADQASARLFYAAFVDNDVLSTVSPWNDLVANVYLGDQSFIADVERRTAERGARVQDPSAQRNVRAVTLTEVIAATEAMIGRSLVPKTRWNETARAACALLASSLTTAPTTEVARALAISPSGVRALARRARAREPQDENLAEVLALIASHLQSRTRGREP